MPLRFFKKKKYELVPGTLVECESGRFLAFYEHRTDIIASGENEKDAITNLRIMYKIVVKHEVKEATTHPDDLPATYKTRSFQDRLSCK